MRIVRTTLVALLAAVLSFGMLAGVAAAGDYPVSPPSSQVLNDGGSNPTGGSQPKTQVLNSSSSLPVTGGDVIGLVVIGAAAVGIGVGLTTYRRRAVAEA